MRFMPFYSIVEESMKSKVGNDNCMGAAPARRTKRSAASALLLALLINGVLCAQERTPERPPLANIEGGKLEFSVKLVPSNPGALPVLRLSPQKPPTAFVEEILGKLGIKKESIAPLAKLPGYTAKGVGEEFVGVAEEGRLRAYWNERTGDAEIFPLLERQKPEKAGTEHTPQSERAGALAKQIFARPDVLEKDSTRVLVGEPLPLLGTTANREGREGKIADSGRETI